MSTSFRFVALPSDRFEPLFAQSDTELAALGARRMIVDEKPGFPCRVSLADAEVGETVVLLPFTHHDVASPYRSSGPIFVRKGVPTATPAAGEIPLMLRHRLLSIRAYDAAGMMSGADVVSGSELEAAHFHVHNAKPGCYNCTVVRA